MPVDMDAPMQQAGETLSGQANARESGSANGKLHAEPVGSLPGAFVVSLQDCALVSLDIAHVLIRSLLARLASTTVQTPTCKSWTVLSRSLSRESCSLTC